MSVRTEPCDWPVSYAACAPDGGLPEPLASMPSSGVTNFETMAATYLWNWTGKALGLCEVTISPCRADCTAGMSSYWGSGPKAGPFGGTWTPVIIDGLWFNVGCGICGDTCGCDSVSPLAIPGPVDSVSEIKVDGEVLNAEVYYVDNNSLLVRTDGQRWAPCGLEITYERGVAVPIGGQIAAGVLANELAKAACGDKTCGLPQRVQTITRQGVTVALLDAFDDIDKGHTGIWLIDSWLASMMQPPPPSRVLSPDMPRHSPRRKTWP